MLEPIARLHPHDLLKISLISALILTLCSGSHAAARLPGTAPAANAPDAAALAPAAPLSGETGAAGVSARPDSSMRPSPNLAQWRAIWVDGFNPGIKSPAEVDRLIADVHAVRANVIFAQVRKRGDAYYNRGIEPRADDLRTQSDDYDPLAYLIQRAHAARPPVEVHAWLNAMPVARAGEPPTSTLHVFATHGLSATGADNWLSRSASGGYVSDGLYFLDPGHPAVAQYTADLYTNLVRNYDLDGIHLDFIRYSGAQWGYNPTSVARYNSRFGTSGQPAPDDPRWLQWRRDQVTNLVRQVYLQAIAVKPQVKVSAALITWGRGPQGDGDWPHMSAYNDVLQDWPAWLREGILDLAVPMNYDDDQDARQHQWFGEWLDFEKTHRFGRQLIVGVAGFMNQPDSTRAQVARALAPGASAQPADGVALFSYAAATTAERDYGSLARALAQAPDTSPLDPAPTVFGDWARTPEMPWKTRPKTGYLKGLVRDSDGPADSVEVQIQGPTDRALVTAGTGFYGALDLPPGIYTVQVVRDGQVVGQGDTAITPGRVSTIDIDIPSPDEQP